MFGDFLLFQGTHLVVIMVLILGVIGVFLGSRLSDKNQERLGYTIGGILAVQIVVMNIVYVVTGSFDVQRLLPLHLCNITAFMVVLSIFSKKDFLSRVTIYWSPISALLAILAPDIGRDDNFPKLHFIEFFVSHLCIVFGTLFLLWVRKLSISYKNLWQAFGILFAYMIVVYGINKLIGGEANYLYLIHKTRSPSPMDFLPNEPYHIIGLNILTIAVFHIEFLFAKIVSIFDRTKL